MKENLSFLGAQTIIDNLNYDFAHFSMDDFLTWLETQTERSIKLISWPLSATISGAWISTSEGDDYVFYNELTPPLLQLHIQTNLLSRILLGHKTLVLDTQNRNEEIDVKQISFRGEWNSWSKQALQEMVQYVIKQEG